MRPKPRFRSRPLLLLFQKWPTLFLFLVLLLSLNSGCLTLFMSPTQTQTVLNKGLSKELTKTGTVSKANPELWAIAQELKVPLHVGLSVLNALNGDGEIGNTNRSDSVDKWNTDVGAPLGSPYCASNQSANNKNGLVEEPRISSPRAADFAPKGKCFKVNDVLAGFYDVKPGDYMVKRRFPKGNHVVVCVSDVKPDGRVKVADANSNNSCNVYWTNILKFDQVTPVMGTTAT